MPANPLIAVPTYHLPGGQIGRWGSGGYALPALYVDALVRAGAAPLLVPSRPDVDAASVLAPCAGLLLPGGGDIDPARYGQAPHPAQYGLDPDRDDFELAALAEARRLGLPVLAICRGMQIVDVAAGGTLVQHIPDQTGLGLHGTPGGGGHSALHAVRVDPSSRLAAAVGATATGRIESCTSWHHQGVASVGSWLRPVAWTDDGLVEAVEPVDGDPWFVAVQWHPETTAAADPAQQALFDAFVRACAAGQAAADHLDVSPAAQDTTSRSEPVGS